MDTIVANRAAPPSDFFAPRVAQKSPNLENPVEKTVSEVKDSAPASIRDERAAQVSAERTQRFKSAETQQQDKLDRGYVSLPDNTFAYRVVNEGTKQVVVQIPSEQAIKLRAYLEQQEARLAAREDTEKGAVEDIVA